MAEPTRHPDEDSITYLRRIPTHPSRPTPPSRYNAFLSSVSLLEPWPRNSQLKAKNSIIAINVCVLEFNRLGEWNGIMGVGMGEKEGETTWKVDSVFDCVRVCVCVGVACKGVLRIHYQTDNSKILPVEGNLAKWRKLIKLSTRPQYNNSLHYYLHEEFKSKVSREKDKKNRKKWRKAEQYTMIPVHKTQSRSLISPLLSYPSFHSVSFQFHLCLFFLFFSR